MGRDPQVENRRYKTSILTPSFLHPRCFLVADEFGHVNLCRPGTRQACGQERELKWEVFLSNGWLCLGEPAARSRQVPDPTSARCQTLAGLTPSAALCASPDLWLAVSATAP